MNTQLSTSEHFLPTEETTGGSQMENRAKQIIQEVKEIKEKGKYTYNDILEIMEQTDSASVVSLSTLRRVFRDGSESKSTSFNYEEILLPIYNAVKKLDKTPKVKSPFEKELEGFKSVIRVQAEELDRLFEMKEHLDERVDFLVGQIKIKDAIIQDFMKKMDEKDAIIARLMDKCL